MRRDGDAMRRDRRGTENGRCVCGCVVLEIADESTQAGTLVSRGHDDLGHANDAARACI